MPNSPSDGGPSGSPSLFKAGRPVVAVVGATGGIGAVTARLAARRGYDLALGYRSGVDRAEALALDCRAMGARAEILPCDMADETSIQDFFVELARRFGRLDLLVNAAGVIGPEKPAVELQARELAALWSVNLTGPILTAREALAQMADHAGAAIVNVSSLAGKGGGRPCRLAYGASKAALNAATITLAREAAGRGIRVNAVLPGLIDTPMHDRHGHGYIADTARNIPLGRAGTPGEVAKAILWLASSEAGFITGALVDIGGGAG